LAAYCDRKAPVRYSYAFKGRFRALAQRAVEPLGWVWTAIFVLLSVAMVYPIWRAKHPPLQDLPQHLAAINVLKNYPALGLGHYFELQLSRTQYLGYYLVAQALSYLTGVTLANKIILCSALIALPWSIASLLKALGRDARLAIFAFGLTYNAHLVLGFFNFLAALPLVFWGLTAAVRLREKHTVTRMVVLGVLALLCFYMHVVPFAFLGLGSAIVLIGDSWKLTLQRALAFVPVGTAALAWLASTPAGRATLAAAEATESVERPTYSTIGQAMRELPTWLTDVLHRERDDQLLVAWGALLLICVAVGWQPARKGAPGRRWAPWKRATRAQAALPMASDAGLALASASPQGEAVALDAPAIELSRRELTTAEASLSAGATSSSSTQEVPTNGAGEATSGPSYAWLVGMLSPLAFIGYFVLPTAYDWIWPISGRFPLLSLLFIPLLLPRMRGAVGASVLVGVALVSSLSFYEINKAFVQFEREEVGDIDAAIAAIPRAERVAGLIFGGSSNIVRFAPFLHYVALYQAKKGGVVMFTFAEFPQSPFRFKADTRPPVVTPRWEWTPERVDPDRDLTWYKYILVRGGPGRIQRSPYFENVFQGAGWTVWRRVDT